MCYHEKQLTIGNIYLVGCHIAQPLVPLELREPLKPLEKNIYHVLDSHQKTREIEWFCLPSALTLGPASAVSLLKLDLPLPRPLPLPTQLVPLVPG